MQEQDGLNPEELELERALRSLSPAGAKLNPIAAAFEAGQQFRQRQTRAWSAAFVALLLASSLSLLWMHQSVISERQQISVSNVTARAQAQQRAESAPRLAVISTMPGERTLITSSPMYAPPVLPSLIFLQRTVEKDGLDGMPKTSLPVPIQGNFNNQL
jgi:hypothetical protein